MDLIALKELRHGGVLHAEGDAFTANTRDGRILVALKKARLAEVDAVDEPAEPKSKRTYNRRDMTATKSTK